MKKEYKIQGGARRLGFFPQNQLPDACWVKSQDNHIESSCQLNQQQLEEQSSAY